MKGEGEVDEALAASGGNSDNPAVSEIHWELLAAIGTPTIPANAYGSAGFGRRAGPRHGNTKRQSGKLGT
jgi:hypothetical protein